MSIDIQTKNRPEDVMPLCNDIKESDDNFPFIWRSSDVAAFVDPDDDVTPICVRIDGRHRWIDIDDVTELRDRFNEILKATGQEPHEQQESVEVVQPVIHQTIYQTVNFSPFAC